MLRGTSRGIVGFDPTTIPGCTVWFDAADPATFGLSGTSLQTWRSKGSATCTATYKYNAPSVSTISGLSTIYFNGVSTMMTTNSIASYGAIETTWITCATNFRAIADTASSVVIATISGSAGGERSIRFDPNATAYSVNTSVFRGSSGDNANGIRGFIDTAAYFATFTNGSLVTSNTTAVTFQAGVNQGFQIGQWGTWLNGYVYEILIYNRALSLGEYQSVEGYLSQKWGFSPAKVFTPLSIPGCSIWFDAADMSSLTTSGTNITSWTNKGSIPLVAYPLTGGLGTPVGGGTNSNAYGGFLTTGASINGLNAVNCPQQTTYGMSSTVTFPTQARAVFAVYRAASAGAAPYITFFGCLTVVPNNQNGMANFVQHDGQGPVLFAEVGSGAGSILGGGSPAGTFPVNTTGMIGWVQSAISTGSNFVTMNGVPQSITTNQLATTYVTTPQYYFIGSAYTQAYTFCEYIMFNSEISISQRQAVEGYLAWKWGIQGSLGATHPNYLTTGNFVKSLTLATTHPFYSQIPQTRAFTPIDIPGCALWLDGADSSAASMTVSSTTISVWKDKSQNAYSFAGTAVLSTISGFSAPWFNYANTNPLTYLTCTTLSIPQPYTVFAVGYSALNGGNTRMVNGLVGGTYDTSLFIGSFGSNATVFTGNGSSWNSANGSLYGIDLNVWSITAAVISNANVNGYFNGTTITPVTGSYTPATLTGLNVGGGYETLTNLANTNYQPWSGSIGEILFYSGVLTTAQRQSIEGYLAAKWGLKASMPAFVNPTSIPGCALWFDGNDPAGTGVAPANGASVSAWVNKGTTAVTMAYGTSQPTFSSNFQNGFGSVAFNGNYFSGACSFNLAAKSGFLVCSQSSSVTDSPQGFLSFYGSGADTVGSTNGYGYQASQGGPTFGWLYDIFSTGYYLSIGGSTNTPIAVYSDVFASGTQQTFKNGTAGSTATPSSTPGTSTTLMLGARLIGGSLRGSLYGNICEVIVYNVGLSIAQRQTVEGYLAWKWGLQAQLPATHPFYAAAPLPHSFNKVPPTVRQPALYYDVAPGNWTRDWQPYLQALTKANTGATATATTISVASQGHWGGVLAPNGCIYCAPTQNTNVLVINTLTNTTSNLAVGVSGYQGGVLAGDGKIYFIPSGSPTSVLVVNPNDNSYTTFSGTASYTGGWVGGALAPNGLIYCAPLNSTNVLVIDPINRTTSNLVGAATYPASGNYSWQCAILAPNGLIYMPPTGASTTLVVNPATNTTSNMAFTSGSAYQTNGWIGGVLHPNGKIYCTPYSATAVLIIDPIAGTTNTTSLALAASSSTGVAAYTTPAGWSGATLGPNGKIYCSPHLASSFLVIDPTAGTTSNLAVTNNTSPGAILAPNGNIYAIPRGSAATTLMITFSTLAQSPSYNYCLSSYANRF